MLMSVSTCVLLLPCELISRLFYSSDGVASHHNDDHYTHYTHTEVGFIIYFKKIFVQIIFLLGYGLPLKILFLLAQVSFNISLETTTISTNNILSSTSVFYTYGLSILLLKANIQKYLFISVCTSFVGVLLVCLNLPQSHNTGESVDTAGGMIMAAISAMSYALFTVVLKGWYPTINMSKLFWTTGLCLCILSVPILYICDMTTIETYTHPTSTIVTLLLINGIFGVVLSDYLWGLSVLLLSPVAATVGICLTIPLAVCVCVC
eukprot:GHVR01024980.1.p1 GENE.GHVR01024980.1~~GHVR01024980.1.p1  ORF type:complete len:263 (+),score=61.95 GHVR01024980.1:108-896(+)